MTDREKVIKEFEAFVNGHCPSDFKHVCHIELMETVLALLKKQNGLMLALEQSNAANEYLNAEVERLNGLLKEQENTIDTLNTVILGYEIGAIKHNDT